MQIYKQKKLFCANLQLLILQNIEAQDIHRSPLNDGKVHNFLILVSI